MQTFDHRLSQALDRRQKAGQLRALRPLERLGKGRVRIEGRIMVDFSSNDYLGLSHHPHLIARSQEWTWRHGAGAGASRLVAGHSLAISQLEARIAAAKGCESALIFASGWQCNASLLPPLLDPALWEGRKPVVLVDKLIHASLYAGCGLAETQPLRFRHNDLNHLDQLLQANAQHPLLVITESVFSMDGDQADLPAIQAL